MTSTRSLIASEHNPPTHFGFKTTDPDVASETVNLMYPGNRLRSPGKRPVSFRIDSITAGPVRVDRAKVGLPGRAVSDPMDYLLLVMPTAGGAEVTGPRGSARVGPHQSLLCPIGVTLDINWTSAFDQVVIPIPLDPVAQHAAAAFGIRPDELRFEAMMPATPALNRYWQATVDHLVREISAEDSALAHPLIQAQAAEMLAAGVLATFPNTASRADYTRGSGKVGPAALRRAMAFVDTNADRPITATEIAEAAGLGIRGVQKVFAQHLAVTPMGYARRVRLERAHRDLQAADPSAAATVKAIAARWGFANPDRFASAYRAEIRGTAEPDVAELIRPR